MSMPENTLARCSSPYLRQHADNPVAWVPWSSAAFAEARRRDVPVLVSIGYSTCHWCHVMAHESFEDPATAEQMNQQFVCIKVDREEHPEVDAIYMDAVQALTGHGGWPLNAFCDHEGRPFYAGTYFPRERWRMLCAHLDNLWRTDRPKIANAAVGITRHLEDKAGAAGDWPADLDEVLVAALDRGWDPEHPGWAGGQRAPKFPPSQLLNLLITDPRPAFRERAAQVLTAMQDAGIHDRVGGGFHRYSVDRAWRLPHFEKMLYDNAQLAVAYATAGTVLDRPDFTRTACAIGDYLLRDLRVTDAGAFVGYAAAEDADDPGGEGSFYAWSPQHLMDVLGDVEGRRLAEAWDLAPGEPEVGPHGHVDPVLSHIPHPRGRGSVADADRLTWEVHHTILRELRRTRPRPGRDDKVLTDQNGLALEAFAVLARHTGEARFTAACTELAAVLASRHTPAGLLRLADRPAYITDYGSLACGLLAAFEALGDPALVDRAEAVCREAIARLDAGDGGYFATPAGRDDLIRRGREQTDHAQPAGINALAVAFGRLVALTGSPEWHQRLEGVLGVQAALAGEHPTACATLLAAARWRDHRTAVVCGDPGQPATQALLAAARRHGDGATLVIPASTPRVVALDADDDHVIAAAVAARAHLIVSGDRKHLLPIGAHQGIAIVTARQALDQLSAVG